MSTHVAATGNTGIQVDFLTEAMLRIRKYPGDTPPQQPLERYGFFRAKWPAVPVETREEAETMVLRSNVLTVALNRSDGCLTVCDADGRELLADMVPPIVDDEGFDARFTLPPERRFFGLGDQTRERLEHRGSLNDLWIRNVTGYIPIPFLLTDDGFGLVVNTTRRLLVDLGHSNNDWFGFRAPGGTLDYYFIHGPSYKEIISRYTDLTGRPPLPPKWALGLWFICRTQANDREFLDDCLNFRHEGIPCDAIGLEPGWMDTNYDFSIDKDWSKARFPVPAYDRNPGRYTFLRAARRMGYKPGLWLCCDCDLSYEAERQVADDFTATVEKGEKRGFEQDEHLSHARRMDPWTRPDTAWFKHLEDFVDQGVEWFKQDGANQVLDHPDRLYGNGMHDDEMHNLNALLYSKQMYEGFARHTGRRPTCFTPAGWAGLQRWTGTWTGDTGGEEKPLAACLNLTMSGHGMVTVDMEVTTKEGIHFGFLLPWVQLNSWNYFRHPWYQGRQLQEIFTDYARMRYDLLPYLYAAAWEAHLSGTPLMRAMPLEFPEDSATDTLLKQYMLGPSLLVGCFTDRVYLPAGEWYNYWTEELCSGPGWMTPTIPENRGGPLMVKAGAIIVTGPPMDYVGEIPEDQFMVQIWPGPDSETVLYEDDGESLAYEKGVWRTTRICQRATTAGLEISIDAAQGDFPGAPADREILIGIVDIARPGSVKINGTSLEEWDGWTYSDEERQLLIQVERVAVDTAIHVIVQ